MVERGEGMTRGRQIRKRVQGRNQGRNEQEEE